MASTRCFLVIFTLSTACTEARTDADGNAASNLVHQDSSDVTVLRTDLLPGFIHVREGIAVTTGDKPNASQFDPSECLNSSSGRLDCTTAFENAFGVHPLALINISRDMTLCQPIKVTTLSKREAFKDSRGIAAYVRTEPDDENRGVLVPIRKLGPGEEVTMKDGTPGVTHEFGILGFCDVGGRFGSAAYKPLMRFVDARGEIYENWDGKVPATARTSFSETNYGIAWDHWKIDREAELLAP